MNVVQRLQPHLFSPLDPAVWRAPRMAIGTAIAVAVVCDIPAVLGGWALPDGAEHWALATGSGPVWLLRLTVVAALAFAAGAAPMVTGAIAVAALQLAVWQSPRGFDGWTTVVGGLVLWIALGSCRRLSSIRMPLLGLRLLVTSLYITPLLGRINRGRWLTGDQLLVELMNTRWSRFETVDWPEFSGFLQGATWLVLAVELLGCAGLWWPRTRKAAVAALALMHVSIAALMTIVGWQVVMLAALTAFRVGDAAPRPGHVSRRR